MLRGDILTGRFERNSYEEASEKEKDDERDFNMSNINVFESDLHGIALYS